MTLDFLGALPPAFILILGAIVLSFTRGKLRNILAITFPVIAFLHIANLSVEMSYALPFMDQELQLLRVDALAKVFGYIFTLSLAAAFLYGFYIKRAYEFVSGLLYVGCALGVVFSGDLLSLYMFWELMAVTSVVLVLLNRTKQSAGAAYRYILVHFLGGLVLLAGLLMHFQSSGSLSFLSFTEVTLGTSLILIGFLVNAAAVPLSSWLPDAYPESTIMGGVILSAYTSKTAIYTLLRGFSSWEFLIYIGLAMTIYGVIYALLENDIRRMLSYSVISQLGFMVAAAGIGTKLAIAGASAHAVSCILYTSLFWMAAGAVKHQTGKTKFTQLGGLYQFMPMTFLFTIIAGLTISAVPFFAGFTTKTMIILAAEKQHLFWAWITLEIASVGVFLHAGLKYPFKIFFSEDKGLRPKEAPKSMLLGMALLAFLCIYVGVNPEQLYNILPFSELVKSNMPVYFLEIYFSQPTHLVTKIQLLSFSALVFFLFLGLLKRTDTISIDFDYTYRKGGRLLSRFNEITLDSLLRVSDKIFLQIGLKRLAAFVVNAPGKFAVLVMDYLWSFLEYSDEKKARKLAELEPAVLENKLPIALASLMTLILFLLLIMG